MSLSNPRINFQIRPAFEKELNAVQKILIIAQMTTGTATPNVIEEELGNANEQDALFGANSMAATAVRAFKRINKSNRVDVLPLEDGAAAIAATGTVVFVGTATENGTIFVSIGSEYYNTYEVTVADTDTATIIGDALVALITADTTSLVTAVNVTGTVTFTAVNKGATGNKIGIRTTGDVAGVTYTATIMTGGTGEPDKITDGTAFALIPTDVRYQTFIYPQTYDVATNYQKLRLFLDARFNADNRILDGQAFIGSTDTLANLKARALLMNNESTSLYANKIVSEAAYKGASIFELDYVIASYFCAIRALRLTEGAQIGQYIVGASGALDDVGGLPLASLPYMNTPFTDLLPVSFPKYFWTDEEVTELLDAGVSVIGNNIANNNVIAGQIVTTYLKDGAGNDDITFRFLNYFDTLTGIREYSFNNLKVRFAQSRLVEGDLTPLRNEANRQTIITVLLGIYQDLELLVLVEKGNEARKFFKRNLTVSIDKTTGTATITMLVSPVVQLRRANIVMQVVFNINL